MRPGTLSFFNITKGIDSFEVPPALEQDPMSIDHTAAPTAKCTTCALAVHPACAVGSQEVYPWCTWSKIYITSNLAKTELLDELAPGRKLRDTMVALALDKHRDAIPSSCAVAALVLAVFIGYIANWSFDMACDCLADVFPLIALVIAIGSTALALYSGPFLV